MTYVIVHPLAVYDHGWYDWYEHVQAATTIRYVWRRW